MSDCTNLEMRDLLPDLARGVLTGAPLVAVEQHLVTCASCREELDLVRRARAVLDVAPAIDPSRIAAAVVRSHVSRPHVNRRVWLAAASIIAVAGAAMLVTSVMRNPDGSEFPPVVIELEDEPATPNQTQPAAPVRATPPHPVRAELVVGAGLSELADADLESLLRALEGLDGQFEVEPAALPPLLEGEV